MEWLAIIETAKSCWKRLKSMFRMAKRVEALERAEQRRTRFGPGHHAIHLHVRKPGHYIVDLKIREDGQGEMIASESKTGRNIPLDVKFAEAIVVGESFKPVLEHKKPDDDR